MQSEAPMIHELHPAILNLEWDLLARFVKPEMVREASDLVNVLYKNSENQKTYQDTHAGFYAKHIYVLGGAAR